MRRLPVVPSLIVAAAVAVMIGLGIWQLERAAWKERLLAEYAAAAALPALDLDPLLDGAPADLPPLAFRRVLVTCHARDAEADIRAGRSLRDAVGQVYVIPCRPGASGLAGRIRVNLGWTERPDGPRRHTLQGIVAGTLGAVELDEPDPIILTAATASPPLVPSAAPSIAEVPNNHLGYAWTWFFFAAAAVVIYVLALRGRWREPPSEP